MTFRLSLHEVRPCLTMEHEHRQSCSKRKEDWISDTFGGVNREIPRIHLKAALNPLKYPFLNGFKSSAFTPFSLALCSLVGPSTTSESGSLRYVISLRDPWRVSSGLAVPWKRHTSIESLCANTDYFEAWMFWNLDLLILVIRSWHPERQSSVLN